MHPVLVTATAPAVWGSTYVVTTTLLPDGRPLLAGALRALPAGLLLLAVTRTLPSGSWWWRSAVLGTLNIGAFFALLFVSAYRLPGGVAAVLGAVGPLLVVALSAGLLGEQATPRRVASALVAAAGVSLTVLTAGARLDPWGLAAGLAGAASMALGLVLTRRWGQPAPALTTTAWQLTAGGLVLLPLTLLVEGPPPALGPGAVGGYAYLSVVGSALAYTLWFRGLERLPAASVSLLGQLSPVVATALGWAVLQQRLTPVQLLGMVIALGGVVAGQAPSAQGVRRGGGAVRGQQELAAADHAADAGDVVGVEVQGLAARLAAVRQAVGSWKTGARGPRRPRAGAAVAGSSCSARAVRGWSSTAVTTAGAGWDSASSSRLSASLSSGRSSRAPSSPTVSGSDSSGAVRSGYGSGVTS